MSSLSANLTALKYPCANESRHEYKKLKYHCNFLLDHAFSITIKCIPHIALLKRADESEVSYKADHKEPNEF